MSRVRSLSFFGAVLPLLLVLAALIGFMHRQWFIDQYRYATYTPSVRIAEIAERASLRDVGMFYFYASQPVMDGTQAFNSFCGRREEKSAILGCYDGHRIYIYDVTDERLQGVEEVTAAHEMLHAVYDRMSKDERAKLVPLLDAEFAKLNTGELKERMEYYDRNEPGQHHNELHSIIATEASDISPELEKHYAKYFNNRQTVVDLHQSYEQQFDLIRSKVDQLASELNALSTSINTATETYNQRSAKLNADIESFNQRAQSGGYDSERAFESDRAALVNRSESLRIERARIEQNIQLFESKRAEYAELASEAETLQQSIDSSLAPAPAI